MIRYLTNYFLEHQCLLTKTEIDKDKLYRKLEREAFNDQQERMMPESWQDRLIQLYN